MSKNRFCINLAASGLVQNWKRKWSFVIFLYRLHFWHHFDAKWDFLKIVLTDVLIVCSKRICTDCLEDTIIATPFTETCFGGILLVIWLKNLCTSPVFTANNECWWITSAFGSSFFFYISNSVTWSLTSKIFLFLSSGLPNQKITIHWE